MKKIFFLLCVSIGLNLYATTVGDLTSAVCKDATYPCDICSNENSTMAQCKCEAGTSWNSTLKICETAKDACTSPAYWNNTKKTCEAIVTSTYAAKLTWDCYGYVDAGGSDVCNGKGYTYHVLPGQSSYTGAGHPHGDCDWNENTPVVPTDQTYNTGRGNKFNFGAGCVATFDAYKDEDGKPITILPGQSSSWSMQNAMNGGFYPISNLSSSKYSCDVGDGEPASGTCIKKTIITKPSNCTSPSTGVTSSGKCYQNTSCPLGNYTCASTTVNGGGTIDDTDTTQGATDKTANGTTNSSGQCSGKIYIFNGKDMRCRPPGMQTGYSDCCTKTDSWFGLTKCGTSEVALGKARVSGNSGDGYCHYVGSYCAEEWNLGVTKVCVQKKKTYCCFNGLLGRVIQEQGRPQLGIGWGSAEGPECRGFTPDEFQKLDFSKIDLGEFTQAITANAAANINKNLGPQINAEIDRFNNTIK